MIKSIEIFTVMDEIHPVIVGKLDIISINRHTHGEKAPWPVSFRVKYKNGDETFINPIFVKSYREVSDANKET